MRLQKYLASCGVASRRHAEQMIAEGLIQVNGQTITEMGFQVTEDDEVRVRGDVVKPEEQKHYVLYHKPMGEVTTVSDDKGRETVMDHFRDYPVRLYPIGRLDYDSEGLLLLTNDGDLAAKLTHPRHEVDKTYEVSVRGYHAAAAALLRRPIELDGYPIKEPQVKLVRADGDRGKFLVTIHEGRNRQVRRMCEAAGMTVTKLRRVQEGSLKLGNLPLGKWRNLTDEEVAGLK